jgi:hypothetical protein
MVRNINLKELTPFRISLSVLIREIRGQQGLRPILASLIVSVVPREHFG